MGCLLLAGCVLASASSVSRAAEPQLLKKLYVVMVFDTNDEDLAASLKVDKGRLKAMLKAAIPSSRYEIVAELEGAKVTAKGILDTVKSLKGKVSANDAVLFYYGGHGALNDTYGHVLKMTTNSKDLQRSFLRKELEKLGAGLTVLLTDCCSNKEKADGPIVAFPPGTKGAGDDPDILPTVRALFFQARGIVDVTAATEEAAWSDDKNGGLFTRSLVKMLLMPPSLLEKLGGTKDGAVTWEAFFPALQADTQQFFKKWSASMMARFPDARIRAETQKPHAFFLGGQTVTTYAVVDIENGKTSPLKYRFRWEEKDEYNDFELKPGERKTHMVAMKAGAGPEDLPKLEILREGAETPNFLKTQMWAKDRAPRNIFPFYRIKK